MGDVRLHFEKAARRVSSGDVSHVSQDERLELYALYSVVKKGVAPTNSPSAFLDPVGFAKWTAWDSLKYMPTDEAMHKYITLVETIAGRRGQCSADHEESEEASGFGKKALTGFDICQEGEEIAASATGSGGGRKKGANSEKASTENDICYWAALGDVQRVRNCLSVDEDARDFRDAEGLTALMRAADRNEMDVVQLLLRAGTDVNLTDGDGLTALHYAVYCDHDDMAAYLVARGGALVDARDRDGLTAVEAASPHMRAVLQKAEAEAEAEAQTRYVNALQTVVQFVGGGDTVSMYVGMAVACAVSTLAIAWTWASRNR